MCGGDGTKATSSIQEIDGRRSGSSTMEGGPHRSHYKSGSKAVMSNFRPVALTSANLQGDGKNHLFGNYEFPHK